MVSLALVITISNASGLFRRSDLSAAYALVGVSDPLLGLTHSREVHHSVTTIFYDFGSYYSHKYKRYYDL